MAKSIVMIGTTDTKWEQLGFLRRRIEEIGFRPILMDISMGKRPSVDADIGPDEIAARVGKDIEQLRGSRNRAEVTDAMTAGAVETALGLLSEGKLDGIVALGGATIALVGARVMARLPFGLPKLIATPAAMPAYINRWFEATDLAVMQIILEVSGMSDLMKNALAQVAGAICGMAEQSMDCRSLKLPYPSVAVTELGFSDQCAKNVEKLLIERGYHVFPFHAQGVSDRAMDRLIEQGFFDGVVEIVPAGLVEEKFKGNRAAGMKRLDAALERGIPQVWAPCCLNLTGAGPTRHNRPKYVAGGRVLEIDQMRAMTRFPVDELLVGARMYAEKMNKAKGPLKLVVPLRGWSSIDQEGGILYDPAEDRLFVEELKRHLRADIPLEELDCNLEDMPMAERMVDILEEFMKRDR